VQCVVLAGGQGTRLRGVFGTTPKHLVPVNGQPFADFQVSRLIDFGFTRLTYAVGFGATEIVEYFQDRDYSGLEIDFVVDGPTPLGTGGAIRQINDLGLLDEVFAVTYGDTLLDLQPARMFALMETNPTAEGVLAVWKNKNFLGDSNASFDGKYVDHYDKSKTKEHKFEYIDYGLMVLRQNVVSEQIQAGVPTDLASVITDLASAKQLLGLEVFERFYEVGTLDAIRETEQHVLGLQLKSRDRNNDGE